MIKPAALRTLLKQAIPALAEDPDRLLIFADEGQVIASGTGGQSFDYQYTLNLIFTDMRGSADDIMLTILGWAQVNQPELLGGRDRHQTLGFEVDQLTHDTYDLAVKLPLTESVVVTPDGEGQRQVKHVAEEAPEWLRTGFL